MNYNIPKSLKGLNEQELQESRKKYGFNETTQLHKTSWHTLLLDILKEPMLLLLFAVTIIYLIVGNYSEALFMFAAIIAVSGISYYQDNRSQKALEALQELSAPLSIVIRDSKVLEIPTYQIAVGDLCIIEEGKMVNCDGQIIYSSDLSLNESSLTGESFSVFKSEQTTDNKVYSGTSVVSGLAVIKVEHIGTQTKLGQIGQSLKDIVAAPSPLQVQITKFVGAMTKIGIVVFLIICVYNFIQTRDIIDSLLSGLTLAMSILPEEIPVAFTTFMALGSYKLMQQGILIKKSSVVETLGSTTVICTDKTGTITQNIMELKYLYNFGDNKTYKAQDFSSDNLGDLISYAMFSSEPIAFDPMEKSIHQVYQNTQKNDLRPNFQMIHEYPLEGKPPMMTHIFEDQNQQRIMAAKGAPEAILQVCKLTDQQRQDLQQKSMDFTKEGYRVLGVAKCDFKGNDFLEKQQDFDFEFLGFTVFYDPPKDNIQEVFQKIYKAGIQVKVITGDNCDTTKAIANQAGIVNNSPCITGVDISQKSQEELQRVCENTTIFARMFPQAKLQVVEALKQQDQIVAMIGDGVNDAPALKAAHIGVAMGQKGTEIAKQAADVVITNDDLDKLITAISAGRRIYANIKKAIQYIISIHIPIILVVSIPLLLGWVYPKIFTPVHVIFLELIMGPTCSIVFENEPIEKDAMLENPRKMSDTFLNIKELSLSIIQGLVITLGVLSAYWWAVLNSLDQPTTRGIVFCTLIFANIFLCLANRSFTQSILQSIKNKNRLFPIIIGITLCFVFAILYIPFLADFFEVSPLNGPQLLVCLLLAGISVLWFEIYKAIKRAKKASHLTKN